MKLETRSRSRAGFLRINSALIGLLLTQAALIGSLLGWRNRIATAGREEITSAIFALTGAIIAAFVLGCSFRRKPLVSSRRPIIRRRKAKGKEE